MHVTSAEIPLRDEARPPRTIRSFVRREGRITTAQSDALAQLWTRFGIGSADAPPSAAPATIDPHALFGRDAPLAVEIGFGNGEHLAASALARPESDFIGIEVHRPGVGHLLQRAHALKLNNLRVICADAVAVLRDALADGSLAEIAILFPDPWPKKRHGKRRLIQPAFANELVRVLQPGGILRLATDWADYAQAMRAVLDAAPEFCNQAGAAGYVQRPAARATTRFEARGLRLGHAVFDLEYRRR